MGETWACRIQKNHVDILCRLSTIHERERQTNRPRNGNINRNKRNRFSGMSPTIFNYNI